MAYSLRPISPLRHRSSVRSSSGTSQPFTSFPRASQFDLGPAPMTAQQLFATAMAKNVKPKRSLVGNVLHAGEESLKPVEYVFKQILRPWAAVGQGFQAAQEAKNRGQSPLHALESSFIHGAATGFHHPERFKGYGHFLDTSGILRDHRVLRGVAGFGLDVSLDPLTYLSLGTSAGIGAADKGYAAGRTLLEHDPFMLEKGATSLKFAKGTERSPNFLSPQHLDVLTHDLKMGGEPYQARLGLAKETRKMLEMRARGAAPAQYTAQIDRVTLAQGLAKAEEIGHTTRLPFLQFKLGSATIKTPTTMFGRTIVPKLPPAGKIGLKLEQARVPLVSGPVGFIRKAFGSGKGDIMRQLVVYQRHIAEGNATHLIHGLGRQIAADMPKLSDHDTIDALSYFEKKGSVVKQTLGDGTVRYNLSLRRQIDALKSGKLSHDQIRFVQLWHMYAETLRNMDTAYGIKYTPLGEQGKLYVPHLVSRDGVPFTNKQKQFLKQAGFSYQRTGKDLTLNDLIKLKDKGALPRDINVNPMEIMAHASINRSIAYGQKVGIDVVAHGMGIPTKIIDRTKLAAQTEKHGNITEKLTAAQASVVKLKAQKKSTKAAKAEVVKQQRLLTRTESAMAKTVKGAKNPEYSKSKHVLLPGAKAVKPVDEFGHEIAFEPRMGEALNRYRQLINPYNDEATAAVEKAFRQSISRWKLGVTAVNPGYRIRNTITDFANMWLDGVPLHAMPVAAAKGARMMARAKAGGPENIDATIEMVQLINQGAVAGQFGGDMQSLSEMLRHAGSKRSLVKNGRFLKLGSKIAYDINRNAENWGRITHYMYRTRFQRMGITDAIQHVKDAHFDYEDLTPFEQHLKSKWIPFYTWTRKNLAFQFHTMLTKPGRTAMYPKLAIESQYAAGGPDKGTIIPSYVGEAFGFRVPVGRHNYLNTASMLGIGSLQFLEGPKEAAKQSMQMVNPFIKLPFEMAVNKSILTGAPIQDPTGHPRTPIAGWAAPLLSMLPGANVGPTSRVYGGKRTQMTGANPEWIYALSQFPLSRILLQGPGSGRPNVKNMLGGYLGGISTVQLDPQQQQQIAQIQFQDQLKGYIKGLRDEGKYPASIPRVSKHQKQINKMIQFRLGG